MIVRKLRLQRGWSQEQLAQMSGLSVRTIQRIERGQKAGLESKKSLAAVFEIELSQLTPETDMNTETSTVHSNQDELKAIEYVRDLKGFYTHLACYVVGIMIMAVVNLVVTPDKLWVVWPALGWGIGVLSHGISVFELVSLFSVEWERKQVEKRLGRKL